MPQRHEAIFAQERLLGRVKAVVDGRFKDAGICTVSGGLLESCTGRSLTFSASLRTPTRTCRQTTSRGRAAKANWQQTQSHTSHARSLEFPQEYKGAWPNAPPRLHAFLMNAATARGSSRRSTKFSSTCKRRRREAHRTPRQTNEGCLIYTAWLLSGTPHSPGA